MFLEGNSLALRGLLRSIEDPGIGEREGKKERVRKGGRRN